MAYPFLYGAAASLLPALDGDADDLESFFDLPDTWKKDLEEWRETLTFLPSIIESHGFSKEHLNSIYKLVYGFHYECLSDYYIDWEILANRLKKFQVGLHPIKNNIGKDKSLLSISLSLSLSALLSNALSSNNESPDVKVKHKLEGLPPHLVPCVAYCALYPEGYIFVRETLVNHWISQGLIEVEVDQTYHRWRLSAQYLEERGEMYFDELQQRWGVFVEPTFVFGGDIYSCRMDPVVHQAARRMASTEVTILLPAGDSYGSAPTATARHIATHHKETSWNIPPPSQTQSHNILYTYMCFTPQFQISDLEVGLHRLRVLDLSGALFQSLPPSDSFHPRELCYLGLSRNTLLESLDLSRFPDLITAAFDGCLRLEKLNSTIKMPNLRHLYYTSKSSNLRIMDASNLKTLQVSHCPNLISLSLGYNLLRRLRIFECPILHSIDLNSSERHIHQELILHSCVHLISIKPRANASSIHAQLMEIIDMPELTQLKEWFPYISWGNTRHLMIAGCISLGSIHDILPHLDSLEKLRIYHCRNLWIAPSEFGFLTKLKSVEISKCPKITAAWKSNAAARDVATFISHIPDVILDGQQFPFIQEDVGSQKLTSSAPGSSSASYRAPVSKVPRDMDIPFFILSSETFKTTKPSQGTSDLEYKLGPCNLVTGVLETNFTLFLLLFHSDEFEFERDKLFQLLLGPRLFSISNFDRLLEKEFIIYSRTDILTGISKYRINVKKVNHFSNMLKSEDLAAYAVIDDEIASEVNIYKARHVSVVSKDIDQTSLFENLEGITELRTFLLIGDYGSSLNQIPSTFFTAHQAMETLDLSGSHISELPSSVGEMLLLRFLDLSYTLIQRLPESIHHLVKLQTLRLKECRRLHSLPNRMKELTSLCYLDFDVLGQLTCMPQGMGALTELRTLSAFIVSQEDGCSLRELKNLNNLAGNFCISGLEYATRKEAIEADMIRKRDLTQLHLKWDESYDYDEGTRIEAEFILKYLRMESPLKELQISYYPGSSLPTWISGECLEQLVSVTFHSCDVISLLSLDTLPNLKDITIIDMNRVKTIATDLERQHFGKIRYPKLETLTIDGMLKLEKWTGIEKNDCPFLSKLRVKDCPRLTQLDFLPHLSSLKHLEISLCDSFTSLPNGGLPASLEALEISQCHSLNTTCSKGGQDWEKIRHVPNIWIDTKGIGFANEGTGMLAQDCKFKKPCNNLVQQLECRYPFLHLFHSDEIEFEFERDKLFQLLLGTRIFGISNFDRLLEKEFIIYSRTDILTGISKYRINVKRVNHFSNMLKSEDLAAYAVIDDEIASEVNIYKARHVSVVSKDIDQTSLFENLEGITELRTFLLIGDYGSSLNQIPSTFFTAHQAMETLDLSGSHISELPSSVGEMLLLRFLDLSYTLIQRLPESIHHLVKLQTLRLKECRRLHSLPNRMKELTSLCYLDFDVLGQLTCMPQGMGALTELRTLSAFIVSQEDGCSLRELKNLNNLAGNFCISGLEYATRKEAIEADMIRKRDLTQLHLKWDESYDYDEGTRIEAEFILKYLRMESPLKELQISYYPGSSLPTWISGECLEQLVSVTFHSCDVISLLSLDTLPNLKDITIIDMNRVKTIATDLERQHFGKIRYPKLETLTIDGMLKLEKWTGIEKNDCPFLSKLRVKDCPRLTQLDFLPHLSSLKHLEISLCDSFTSLPNGGLPASLEALEISQCHSLNTTCSKGGQDWEKIRHVPNIWIDTKGIGFANEGTGMLAQDCKFKKPCNNLVQQLECRYPFLHLFHSDEIEFEFERDKLFQLLLGTRIFGISNFDRLLEKEFIIYSRTDILTGISKYRINVKRVNHFSNMLKSEDLAAYAVIDDEIASEVNIYKARHVSVVSKDIDQTSLFENLEGITELRTFLLIGDYGSSLNQIPSTFFTAHQAMETLDLSGSHISELPSSVGEMLLLRFLDLSYTLIQRLPESIHHLVKLQTLRLKECRRLHSLPNRMKELTSLCYLDFDVLGQLTCMPQGMGALTELRTLSAFIVSQEDGCSLRELKNLNNLAGNFCISGLEYATHGDAKEASMKSKRNLARLHLNWDESYDYVAHKNEKYKAYLVLSRLEPSFDVEELQISCYPYYDFPVWIEDRRFNQLVTLIFVRCENTKFGNLGRFSSLKHLNLTDVNKVEYFDLGYDDGPRFPRLETLTIDGMHELSTFKRARGGDFPLLSKLSFEYCPKLTQLDFLPLLRSLTYLEISHCESLKSLPNARLPASLETLMINQCKFLKTTCSQGGQDWVNIEHVPNIWIDMKGIGKHNKEPGMLAQDHKFKKPYNILVRQLECHCYPFLLLFYSNKIEFEFERNKLFQLLLGTRLFSISNFDHLLEKELIIYSRTDILTGISKYRINVKRVNHFSNMLKSEDLAAYAVIDDEIASEVNIYKARHVSVISKDINQISLFENLEGITELRTFLLIGDYGSSLNQIPSTFFTAHQAMETLDLSGSHISELPSSVGEMLLLRFLDLSYTLIQRLPESIHHLVKLQTLRLKECKRLHSLPNAMKKLTSLCYLDFDVLGQLTCMPQGMGALTELRTLSAFIVSREDGCTLRELKNLNNLAGNFCISGLEYATHGDAEEASMKSKRFITRLHLKWDESYDYDALDGARGDAGEILSCLKPSFDTADLQISCYPHRDFPIWMFRKDTMLASLTLLRCENIYGLLGWFPSLKHLNLTDIDKITTFNVGHQHVQRFPKLETLTIDGMHKLQSFENVRNVDLPLLSKLSFGYCPKLTQLDFLPLLRSLTYLEISHCESLKSLPNARLPASLETLMINQCKFLKTTCSQGGQDWVNIEHVPNIWIDMKGIGKHNKEPDSPDVSDEYSDYSDVETN